MCRYVREGTTVVVSSLKVTVDLSCLQAASFLPSFLPDTLFLSRFHDSKHIYSRCKFGPKIYFLLTFLFFPFPVKLVSPTEAIKFP